MSRAGGSRPVRRERGPSAHQRAFGKATVVLTALVLGAGLLAGCGDGSSSTTATSTTKSTTTSLPPVAKPPPNAEEGTVFVSLGSATGLGLVLANSAGHTLYAFSSDSPTASTCEGACEKAWPPLLIAKGEPQPSNGTSAAHLGTIDRADGTRQVTYAGQPLYSFSGDKKPGEASGQDTTAFGGTWTALKASGAPAG